MRYGKFGNTDLLVSEIGFGARAIGGGAMIGNTAIGWGEANDGNTGLEQCKHFVDAADRFFLTK